VSDAPPRFDSLVVSDLHLRGGYENRTEGLYHFDEEFADFLRYYRQHRAADRCWRLIIGGDFVEFLYVNELPAADDPLLPGAAIGPSEAVYGLGTEPAKARWKLDVILRSSHPQLLLALARFVAEGNEVVLLRGNHDAEMFWPEVQDHFRRLLAEHHPADVSYLDMKRAVAERVRFAPWFWHEPGVLYVEHGCQYDEFCSFEYFMYPVVPTYPDRIENSISDLSIRYFANQIKLLDAFATENIRSIGEYVVWFFRGNLGLLPRATRLYGAMVRRVVAKSGAHDPEAERRIRAEHERRLAANDVALGLPPGTSAAVQALHATPVMRRVSAAVRFLGVDLVAAATLLAAAAVGLVVWAPQHLGWLALIGAVAVVGTVLYVGSLRVGRIKEMGALHRIAGRLAALFDVRYVVLGHSHRADALALGDGRTYFNIGTWVPMAKNAYFVYFALTGEEPDRRGRLLRWNKRKAEPEAFGGTDP